MEVEVILLLSYCIECCVRSSSFPVKPEFFQVLQSTPDNSNLQGKLKKGSRYREFEENKRE